MTVISGFFVDPAEETGVVLPAPNEPERSFFANCDEGTQDHKLKKTVKGFDTISSYYFVHCARLAKPVFGTVGKGDGGALQKFRHEKQITVSTLFFFFSCLVRRRTASIADLADSARLAQPLIGACNKKHRQISVSRQICSKSARFRTVGKCHFRANFRLACALAAHT